METHQFEYLHLKDIINKQMTSMKRNENVIIEDNDLFYLFLPSKNQLYLKMDPPLSIEELVRELDQPNLVGWKLFSQTSGLTVYRRLNNVCFN